MSRPADPNAEPGTGTQYYVLACVHPDDHPRLAEGIESPEDRLAATQYTGFGRTWQCGGEYWDLKLQDLVELDSVVRKSSWCHAGPPEDGPIKFHFEPEHHRSRGMAIEYDPNVALQDKDKLSPTERFLPRHNVPFQPPPL